MGDRGDVRVDEIAADAAERARRRAPGLTIHASSSRRWSGARAIGSPARSRTSSTTPPSGVPTGGVVEVELHDGTLTVRDHGPGFHEDDLPYVFDRFHRAKDARSKPGSGLGLAIVRQAAEAHGGSVEARNAPGGGALLSISFGEPLELEPAAARADQRALTRPGRGARQLSWLRPEALTVTVIVRARGQEATSSTGAPRFETIAPPVTRTP